LPAAEGREGKGRLPSHAIRASRRRPTQAFSKHAPNQQRKRAVHRGRGKEVDRAPERGSMAVFEAQVKSRYSVSGE